MALAAMEEIDTEAWFDGTKTTDSLQSISEAVQQLQQSKASFEMAATRCAGYQQWYPADRREEVTPDIDYFKLMVDRLGALIVKLNNQELPSLGDIHSISAAMRNEMVVAERKGIAHRGTRHHFPAGHP